MSVEDVLLEQQVLAAIAAGDADAFGRWLAGVERPLRESLRSFAATVDTEAVLQEALLRVWQVAPQLTHDGRPHALFRFASRVARNLTVSEARRRRTVPLSALAAPDPGDDELLRFAETHGARVEPALPDPGLQRALERCMDKLPKKPATALSARLRCEVLPDAALAREAGMTLNTFLQNVTRARRFLLECLRRLGVPFDERGGGEPARGEVTR